MTTNVVGLALLAALVTLAPLALATDDQGNPDSDPARPDDAAWVEDCPPEMLCAASDTPTDDNATDDNVSRGPEDCEYCRYGPDDCIDCTGMPVPADDDTVWGTDCPPGVYCMYDSPPQPETASEDESNEAPGVGIAAGLGIGILALAFVARRRL